MHAIAPWGQKEDHFFSVNIRKQTGSVFLFFSLTFLFVAPRLCALVNAWAVGEGQAGGTFAIPPLITILLVNFLLINSLEENRGI